MKQPCDQLKAVRDSFAKCRTLASAIKKVRRGRYGHSIYRHYTTLDVLIGMIESRTMWLTLGRSAKLDDAQEREKFGTKECWQRTFISCFVHDEEESAAMWGLYCPGDEKAVCISFSSVHMKQWGNALSRMAANGARAKVNPQKNGKYKSKKTVESAEIVDIAYADVPLHAHSEPERGNFLFWDGSKTREIRSLKTAVRYAPVTGMLKDYEWNFEHETRVIVRLNSHVAYARRIAVPIPDELFKGMSITLGPWIEQCNEKKYKDQIETAMDNHGWCIKTKILSSTLSGALGKWKCRAKRK